MAKSVPALPTKEQLAEIEAALAALRSAKPFAARWSWSAMSPGTWRASSGRTVSDRAPTPVTLPAPAPKADA